MTRVTSNGRSYLYAARNPGPTKPRRKHIPPCPHCGQPGGFCDAHLAVLHRIRDEMNAPTGRGKTARDMTRCRVVGCDGTKERGSRFCAEHAEDEDVAA